MESTQSTDPLATNPLDLFLPATRKWFETTLGKPTPPQAQAWPAIQRGENTLVLAPPVWVQGILHSILKLGGVCPVFLL